MAPLEKIFVSVGTTKFDELIEKITSQQILIYLQRKGCKYLTIQIGNGVEIDNSNVKSASTEFNIEIDWYRFKPSIRDDIESADLVISHAGAGSCMEVLNSKKLLIVVINENLMDNHQIELAEQLHKDGHLLYCTPKTLGQTLENLNELSQNLRLFESAEPNLDKFVSYLDKFMGVDS